MDPIIDRLFEVLLCKPHEWKHTVSSLYVLSKKHDSPFNEDAKMGFDFFTTVIYNTNCDACNDKKPSEWLRSFAKAWIERSDLPLFPKECINGTCTG